jgi:hypothetical protein
MMMMMMMMRMMIMMMMLSLMIAIVMYFYETFPSISGRIFQVFSCQRFDDGAYLLKAVLR